MYFITISAGLLDIKHQQKMRVSQRVSALIMYLWFIHRMTRIDGTDGLILGGKPIRIEEIEVDACFETKRKMFKKLKDEGYIKTKKTPYGRIVWVTKAKKIFGQKVCRDTQENEEKSPTNSGGGSVSKGGRALHTQGGADTTLRGGLIKTSIKDNGESLKSSTSKVQKNLSKMQEVLEWSVARRGTKFVNVPKQMQAFGKMKKSDISIDRAKRRWLEMERDQFWKDKGFDWGNVVTSFDRKP